MSQSPQKRSTNKPSRRDIVVGATAATLAASVPFARVSYAQGAGTIKVGLIGCGGRGTGAASQALKADPGNQLVAMGDLFPDKINESIEQLKAAGVEKQLQVPNANKFTGFDGYKAVIEASDVVLLCTTPHFRPMMVQEAVKQGKHMFVEKPVATDPVSLRKCWDSAKQAKQKGLALVSGLCYRYEKSKQETIKAMQDPQKGIGDIRALYTYYHTTFLWHRGTREEHPEWSEMEYQCRNWLYWTWLSGDHIVEQHIHSLDKCAWALGDQDPIACTAMGGRIRRTGKEFGNIYDHFYMAYEYENGVTLHASCRQMNNTATNVSDWIVGTKGTAALQSHYITDLTGKLSYRGRRIPGDNMYQNEHDELFQSIRAGKPIYNGDYMCKSTLMAIMGREAAYTGQKITWEQIMTSKQDLTPPEAYKWGPVTTEPVAIPGVTKLA